VNQDHHENKDLIRLAGWWGNDPDTRFDMHGQADFIPRQSADGWKTSNPSLMAMVPLKESLEMFALYGMPALRERSIRLTNYFEKGIKSIENISSITPENPEMRGCQISVRVSGNASKIEKELINLGIVPDARDPDILRFAPVPMYSTFVDIARGIQTLEQLVTN
jgi:kynureninase